MKLHIELIPKSCWGHNLRIRLKKSDWDKIRKSVYKKQNMHCFICEEKCEILDAHEVWEYDEENQIQKLNNIIGVCKPCHNTIHYGRAQKIGFAEEAKKQFIKVNECDYIDLQNELLEVQNTYNRRSKIGEWKLDLSFIENQGFTTID